MNRSNCRRCGALLDAIAGPGYCRDCGWMQRHCPLCEWYLRCDNWAVGLVSHPVIGAVPCCQRCADRQKFELVLYPSEVHAR